MQEFLHGTSVVILYILPAAVIMLSARKLFRIPDELFRKILHFILLGAYIPFLSAFETWWKTVLLVGILMVVIYPILKLAGYIPGFSRFVNERKQGEFKHSMVLALGMMAVSISICWGWLGDKYLVLASIYAWGVGDAFAALIGKQFGKHKITWKFADSHKSVEGSVAMFVTSALAVLIVLLIRGGLNMPECILISVLAALVASFVELCTNGGLDTVTCPVSVMIVMIPLVYLLGV